MDASGVDSLSRTPESPLPRPRLVDSRLIGLRQNGDGTVEEAPVEHLLLLKGAPDFPPGSEPLAGTARSLVQEAEGFAKDNVVGRMVQAHRQRLIEDLDERLGFVARGFDYQAAELAAARARLTERVQAGDHRVAGELDRVRERQRSLSAARAHRLDAVRAGPDSIRPGEVEFLVHALVVPSQDPEETEQYEADVEAIAVQVATAYEESFNAHVTDVSRPELARRVGLNNWPGFDLQSRRPPATGSSAEKLDIETFSRFALPIVWDYTEVNPLSDTSGNFLGALEWVSRFAGHALVSAESASSTSVEGQSAARVVGKYDAIITDPPYYDAIPYSDCMDFFHVWLRRATRGFSPEMDIAFQNPLGPKWNHDTGDGELIDDASRFDGDPARSKQNYEDGMARSFQACHGALQSDGRLVVVFANKQPDAWETLVAALIRAGFVVDGSWPIQTEMGTRHRARDSAALSSSVWIVCRKRPPGRPGWDNIVLDEMRENITQKLRDFWDAGIRGPDFVWAATGPALEAFSKHPVVRKANAPGEIMTVSEFLREVRRMVVDFVVGRVLTRGGEEAVTGLDDVTTYYLLHRNDFGMEDAPVGGCILYALSCNLSDSALANQHDLLVQSRNGAAADSIDDDASVDEESDDNGEGGSGAKVKLKPWHRRRGRSLGLEAPGGRPAPLIDQVHKLMHLWRAGDQARVNEYLDSRVLQRNALFHQLLQALIELAPVGSDERAVLEAISNHAAAHGDVRAPRYRQPRIGEAP